MPQSVVPVTVLLARDFPVFGGGVEAGMAQVLLKQSKPIPRVVQPHRMDSEGIPQLVRANVVYFSSLGIYQLWHSGFLSTFSDNLPGSVPIDTKDHSPPTTKDRTATIDVFFEHL